MKILKTFMLLVSFLLAENNQTTETKVEFPNVFFLLKGQWDKEILDFCEENSQTKKEELNCKIDTSSKRVRITLKEKKRNE